METVSFRRALKHLPLALFVLLASGCGLLDSGTGRSLVLVALPFLLLIALLWLLARKRKGPVDRERRRFPDHDQK